MGTMSELQIALDEQSFDEVKDDWIRERLEICGEEAEEDSKRWLELESEWEEVAEEYAQEIEWEKEAAEEAAEEAQWLQDKLWYREKTHVDFYNEFSNSITEMEQLLANFNEQYVDTSTIYKMVYAHSVTAMETFLADSLKSFLLSDDKYIYSAISSLSELKDQSFKLKKILDKKGGVKEIAIEETSKLMYHNIPKIKKVYESILGIKINYEIGSIIKITKHRHDIVHRGGKTIDNEEIPLSRELVQDAIDEIKKFIVVFEEEMKNQSDKDIPDPFGDL